MRKAVFDPNGGPIQVEIKAGYAQPGTYALRLWEAGSNTRVQRWEGNFINTDDDTYTLPLPVSNNDGRLIDCLATFTLLPPVKDYLLEVIVTQDGNMLATDTITGTSDELTVSVQSLIELEKR